MSAAIERRRERSNFNGQAITVSYEHWEGFCNIDADNGTISGLIPDTMDQIAMMLNMTINYEIFSPRYIFGAAFDNGTSVGGIGNVASGKHEASVAGFSVSYQRSKAVDFTTPVEREVFGVIVKTPTANDISISNYTNEYRPSAWLSVLIAFLVWWIALFLMMRFGDNETSGNAIYLSTVVTLRAVISKVIAIGNCGFSM